MHVAIDAAQMKFTHVHPNKDILNSLVYLEGTRYRHIIFYSTDAINWLGRFTAMEVGMLYYYTTGQKFPDHINSFSARAAAVKTLAEGMTPRDVVLSELAAQIEIAEQYLELPAAESLQFVYVKGAKQPSTIDTGLFPVQRGPLTDEQIAQAATALPEIELESPRITTPAQREPRAQRAPRGPGGAKPKVWEVADAMWVAAGSPTNKEVVLQLRRKMMDSLEKDHGIPRSTSSTALGNWQKEKLG
jgi:hypothetical protein